MSETTITETPPDNPRRLVRTEDKKIAGVAAGMAHYLGLDPALVRIAFIVLAFAGGVGILLYVAGWIAMPKGTAPPTAGAPIDGWVLAAVAALVIGLALLFSGDGIGPGVQVLVGAGLVAGGIWLVTRDRDEQPTAPVVAAPPAPRPLVDEAPPARRAPVTGAVLSLLSVGAALVVAGVLGGWFDVSTSLALAAALVLVGAGLVVASVLGGAPWLLALGALLTAGLLATAAVEPLVDDGVGEKQVVPASVEELQPEYTYGIGEYTLDLTNVTPTEGTYRIAVELGVGALEIVLPPDTSAVVDAHVRAGDIRLPQGIQVDGWDKDAQAAVLGSTGGRLVIDAEVGLGDLEVRRG